MVLAGPQHMRAERRVPTPRVEESRSHVTSTPAAVLAELVQVPALCWQSVERLTCRSRHNDPAPQLQVQ